MYVEPMTAAEMREWQPIETVPKNGKFLIFGPGGLPWPAYSHGGIIWSNAHGMINCENDPRSIKVQYWMPLPEPPTTESRP